MTEVLSVAAAIIKARAENENQPMLLKLESLTGLTGHSLGREIASTLHLQYIEMEQLRKINPKFDFISFGEGLRLGCFMGELDDRLILIIHDPFDLQLINSICSRHLPREVCVANKDDLLALFAIHEHALRASSESLIEDEGLEGNLQSADDLSLASIEFEQSKIIKFVNSTVYDALHGGASDIHFEAAPTGLSIKYRIDGILGLVGNVTGRSAGQQIISRIKVMAELDIAEQRVPQDGRFKLIIRGQSVDFRVSVMPSALGEDVVIRILDKKGLTDDSKKLQLELLGFDDRSLKSIREMIREPYGMFLVTGPTGSGKTTTLYASLTEINSGFEKIITIEDPVEYQLDGVLQIPVNERKGLTFAKGLRSILRHDPDKILVGEIRDPETAQIAIQSALTGHLVFSTIHANNVYDVFGRFTHMAVDTYSFVAALNGVLAQRLVRLTCRNCLTEARYTEDELCSAGIDDTRGPYFVGRGCGACRGTGYKGRSAITEILRLNDELRELIAGKASIRVIKDAAARSGTQSLRQSAISLFLEGKTSLEEINRVTFSS